jgi:hypothetical protein
MSAMYRLLFTTISVMVIATVTLLNPIIGYTQEDRNHHTIGRKDYTDQLRRLTLKILDPQHPPYSLHPEIAKLAQLLDCCATVRIDTPKDISDGETRTKSGLALSPVMAAMCVQDFARTVVFIRGQYAVLAVPSMAVFSPQEVKFTILDIHPPSEKIRLWLDNAKSLPTKLLNQRRRHT